MDWFLYDNGPCHERVKARIHCEIFLSEHFMKYVFQDSFIVLTTETEMFMIS